MDKFRDILALAIPEDWKVHMRDQIDPIFVGAAGAAYRAKIQLEDPSFHNDIHVCGQLEEHDEL